MAEFTLQEIIDATSGTCKGDVSLQFKDVSTDTRTIEAGYVFVALRGDTFDGNDFINTAIEKGATAAIVEKGRSVDAKGIPRLSELSQTTLSNSCSGHYWLIR